MNSVARRHLEWNEKDADWHPAPDISRLGTEDVHLWRASLNRPSCETADLLEQLSLEERERAARYKFPKDKRRFIVGRGILRGILGRYLSINAHDIQIRYGPLGRPFIEETQNSVDLRFSVSHSEDLVLYALTLGRNIGVDLEYIREDLDVLKIAENFFSVRETTTLQTLPQKMRVEGFYRTWTRKEAYLKACGAGLSIEPRQVEVSLAPDAPPLILSMNGEPQKDQALSLIHLDLPPQFIGAMAVEGNGWSLSRWIWTM
jgi:4'-phosphopantetheinyl transferase